MKKFYLLDKDIILEFIKKTPDKQVLALYSARKYLCAIAAVTWQELIKLDIPKSFMEELEQNIEVIPYEKFSAEICGELEKDKKVSETMTNYQLQLAATAISNGMILISQTKYNSISEKSFLNVENWFS